MQGRKFLAVLLGLPALLATVAIFTVLAAPTGDPEGNFTFTPLAPAPTPSPGDFVVLDEIRVTDVGGGLFNDPLNIDRVCVAKTDGSTVRDSDLLELRLYRESGAAPGVFQGFGSKADDLLDIVTNPDLTVSAGQDLCTSGVRFGDVGVLLFNVADLASETLYIVGTFSPAAQRGDHLQLIVKMIADDDLVGAGQSSKFDNGSGELTKTSTNTTTISGPPLGQLFVIDETTSLVGTAAPGTTVVLQQFTVENRTQTPNVRLERITAYAEGFRGGVPNNSVLAGVQRVRLYRETGSTGPGWQEGDELLGTVLRPNLVTGARFGGNRRVLQQIPASSVQRFYLVADLADGMLNGDIIQGAVEVSSSDGVMVAPPKILVAGGQYMIEAPAPEIALGNATMTSPAKVRLSVSNTPTPGLKSVTGFITFDPIVARVQSTAQGTWRVRGLGNYNVDFLDVDNPGGEIEFLLTLKPGRAPLIGTGEIMEIEFVPAPNVQPGAQTALDIQVDDARDNSNALLVFNEVSGSLRVQIIKGDVNGDGAVTRHDARLLARAIAGQAVLSVLQRRAADVAPPTCSETQYTGSPFPSACLTATDVRWIQEAAAGLRTLSAALTVLSSSELGGVKLLVARESSGAVHLSALGAKRLTVQIFDLTGRTVFAETTTAGALRFEGLANNGRALANGVYLYGVTVVTEDGQSFSTEVRKLLLQR